MEEAMTAPAVHQQKAKTYQWLPYLSLVLLAQVALFLYLAPRDPVLMTKVTQIKENFARQRRRSVDQQNDLPMGTSLTTVSSSHQGLKSFLPAGKNGPPKPTFFVFIGSCAGCVAVDAKKWQEAATQHPQASLVLVSRDTQAAVMAFAQEFEITAPMLADTDGALAKAFNATWVPRAYYFDGRGKLAWLQTQDAIVPGELMTALEAEKELRDE